MIIRHLGFKLSWHSYASIMRKPEDFITVGTYNNDMLIGYGIIAPSIGDVTQRT